MTPQRLKHRSHEPKSLPQWQANLDLTEYNHHKQVPLIPEIIWEIMQGIDESNGSTRQLWLRLMHEGIIDAGMYEAYFHLLHKHRLIKERRFKKYPCPNTPFFFGAYDKYTLTKKGKKLLAFHYSRDDMEESSGSTNGIYSSDYVHEDEL